MAPHAREPSPLDSETDATERDMPSHSPDTPPSWRDPRDPANPQNWSLYRKLFLTWIWIYGNLVATISSSIFSSGTQAIKNEFGVSTEVVTLGVSLFVAGYSAGPPIWSPISEYSGRRYPMLVGMALFTLFCLPVALGKDIKTILVGRFLCGVAAVAPIALFGGGLVDIWNPEQRAIAMATCIGMVLGGPLIAPVIGNYVTASHLGWRWTAWLSCIMGASCTVLVYFGLPETYAPALLKKSAKKESPPCKDGNREGGGVKRFVQIYLVRPFVLLGTEPILVLVTIYQAFVYGILYLVFASYPIIFREQRHWDLGPSSLPFLGMLIGVIAGSLAIVARTKMSQLAMKKGGKNETDRSDQGPIPEGRLPLMMVRSVLLPIGLFIFGWTSAPHIPWPGMVIGSLPVGVGIIMVFVQCMNYILDVYSHVANSALGANTIVRSFFAAGFPLFAAYIYHGLGVAWASSVLGFVSIGMIPIPILFYVYGARVRSWSKNTVS
ncbi:hypothetical protein HIM_10059 [Hirsutella minnesotensis 3608]|uniref:Major facilitator superfamily (MFS) profile domain-containing protein n=1 Tax=Hirsutella minnesotensis 3608 TaxID=1043627 RepID=A0A0F7ZGA6_9HYPO|nr:hypothetical protein HIM_10059 [Hirsutella minnesotensis 3608]